MMVKLIYIIMANKLRTSYHTVHACMQRNYCIKSLSLVAKMWHLICLVDLLLYTQFSLFTHDLYHEDI